MSVPIVNPYSKVGVGSTAPGITVCIPDGGGGGNLGSGGIAGDDGGGLLIDLVQFCVLMTGVLGCPV